MADLFRVQVKHPHTGEWALLDTRTGRIVGRSIAGFPGVPIQDARDIRGFDLVEQYMDTHDELPSNVVDLQTPSADGIVPVVTELLARAKRGEIVSGAFALIYADGDTGHVITATDEYYKTLGSIEQMKHDMCARKAAE